ncbi:DUF2514 family protein [Rahnella woolbedingensis]|uniref:DUF2514 domain-containing protein n=1 Tax=Rahnella woolbedingensis TaxID=1510574 RepID=A0A419NBJ5_9GAMM|nr:DUF2514 family protein [Rahnella woolbedingensis]RJT45677.1 DUF2514 domain-containing protein [Rahnella woolbedingensis]
MNWLSAYWKPIALAFFLLALTTGSYVKGMHASDAKWQLKWTERDKADALALAQLESAARTEEQRKQGEIDAISTDAQNKIDAAHSDAAVAASTADSLHKQADKLAARLTERERACKSSAAGAGQATTSGSTVLAELFRRADERATKLAAIADQSRVRGLACESSYAALSAKK